MTTRHRLYSAFGGTLCALTLALLGARSWAAAPPATAASSSPAASSPAASSPAASSPVASSPAASSPVGTQAAQALATQGVCTEHIPEGKVRPVLKDTFPAQGLAGHHLLLQVQLEHGLGEQVLPAALQIQTQSDAAQALRARGFAFPDEQGPGRPRIRRTETADGASTQVLLPLIALPPKPGRTQLTLPPLPIAMSRASGEVITLCTQSHSITIDDPTVNEPNPKPKGNSSAGRQREFWVGLRNAVYGAAAALALAALGYVALRAWRRRPRALPPPPPPRPPWDVALEAFARIRSAHLVEQGRLDEHFDRVESTLRQYLGQRYGFDGLESTSQEIIEHLRSSSEASAVLTEVTFFLQESDLVKFANVTPTEAQCLGALERSESFVRRSMPTYAAPTASAVGAPVQPEPTKPVTPEGEA